MKKLCTYVLLSKRSIILSFCLCMCFCLNAQNPYKKYTENLPFDMPEVQAPVIPDTKVSLKDFGADPTGISLCTDAFAQAVDALTAKGGGHLVVPVGVWHTGPIVLKSNIDLHLEMGAVIRFAADETLYPIIKTSFEGLDTRRCQSPLSAVGAVNVSITGEGVIDGNGQYWRPVKRPKVSEGMWNDVIRRPGGILLRDDYWVPSESYARGEKGADLNVPAAKTDAEWNAIHRFLRPVMISLVGCKNVLLQGVIFQNSPAWNIHPLMCENIIIDNVLARNPSYAQNGDALDLESCKNALIVNSRFDAGDDGICIKSGKDADGRRRGRPCENVVVGTDVGLRFKSKRGRGGIVENIYIRNISMMDIITDAITFNMYYGGKSVSEMKAAGIVPDNLT